MDERSHEWSHKKARLYIEIHFSCATHTIITPYLTEVITFVKTQSLNFYWRQLLFRSKYFWALEEQTGKKTGKKKKKSTVL